MVKEKSARDAAFAKEVNRTFNAADNVTDIVSSFVSIPALAGGIAEWETVRDAAGSASKAYYTAYSETFEQVGKFNKVLGSAGKLLGVTGLVTSIGVFATEDFSWTNLTKVGINVASLALKATPVGLTVSLTVGLLDYSGILDEGLNQIYNEKTRK